MAKQKSSSLGATLVAVSSVFYASYGIWTTLMGSFFGGYTASALRSTLVLLILAPIAWAFGKLQAINWRQIWPYFAGLVLTSTLVWGPLYFSILQAGVGVSLTINYASLVIGMFLFGWLLAKERFTKSKLLSALLGLSGLCLVFAPSVAVTSWLPLIAAAVSGLAGAANAVISKRMPLNATQSTVLVWVASVIGNTPMALLFGEKLPMFGWHIEWLYLVFFAIVSVLSSWLFIKGAKLIDAGIAGVIGLLEIVFSIAFGVIIFGERPGPIVLLGAVVIIVAAAIPYIKERRVRRLV